MIRLSTTHLALPWPISCYVSKQLFSHIGPLDSHDEILLFQRRWRSSCHLILLTFRDSCFSDPPAAVFLAWFFKFPWKSSVFDFVPEPVRPDSNQNNISGVCQPVVSTVIHGIYRISGLTKLSRVLKLVMVAIVPQFVSTALPLVIILSICEIITICVFFLKYTYQKCSV